jgi:hypothetical protein
MLFMLLLWDPVVQVLALGPIILYFLGIFQHPLLAGLDIVVIIGAALYGIRRALKSDAELRGLAPSRIENRWRPSWQPDKFLQHLSLFVRLRGWRVSSSSVLGQDRVGLVLEKDKCRLAMLCLRPDTAEAASDRDTVGAMARQALASRTAVVSEAKKKRPGVGQDIHLGPAATLSLQFEDLSRLDEVLGLTW